MRSSVIDFDAAPTLRFERRWPTSRRERRALGTLALIVAAPIAAGSIALGYPPVLGAVIAALGLRHLRS